jgi:hypothetical protein
MCVLCACVQACMVCVCVQTEETVLQLRPATWTNTCVWLCMCSSRARVYGLRVYKNWRKWASIPPVATWPNVRVCAACMYGCMV